MAWVHALYEESAQEGKGQKTKTTEKVEWWHDRSWRSICTGGNMESMYMKFKGEPPEMWTMMPGGKIFKFDWSQEKANAWKEWDPKVQMIDDLRQELATVKADLKAMQAMQAMKGATKNNGKTSGKTTKAMKAMKTKKGKARS